MARSNVTVQIRHLHDPEQHPEVAGVTAADRLALVWQLAVEAWTLAGRPIPASDRRSIPVRITRLSDYSAEP